MFAAVNRSFLAAAALIVALGIAGCDDRPKRVPVAGKVVIDGQPVTRGYVTLVPKDGRPAVGQIDKQGNFRLTTFDENDGCLLGTHAVAVVSNQQITPSRMKWLIPKKYMTAEASGIEVSIDKPREDLLIELTWAGGKPFIEDSGGGGDVNPLTSKPELSPPPGEEPAAP